MLKRGSTVQDPHSLHHIDKPLAAEADPKLYVQLEDPRLERVPFALLPSTIMGGLYAPPKLFPVDVNDTIQDTQPSQKANKRKDVDRPIIIGDKSGFAQSSYSRVSTPSIMIDDSEMDDHDDEQLTPQAFSSKGDKADSMLAALELQDSDDGMYHSVKSDDDHTSDVEDSPPHNNVGDLVQSIQGMYRVLDLISEQGSGGLVDKTIIAQDSLRAFTNAICPGAYVSMTKVNFSALDDLVVKPVGIYGSKEEIVRLFLSLGVVDDHVAAQLVANRSESGISTPSLRSGLYVVRTNCEATSDEQLFVVYWPEDGTWDDAAPSSMKRNRVIFMRYLTKMCDQLTALISPEHSRSIVWSEQEDEDMLMEMEDEQDESDRMVTFEVRKSNGQEEAVKPCPGFQATSNYIAMPQHHPEATVDVGLHKPWLLYGETTQGFMTISNLPAREITVASKRQSIPHLRLGIWLKQDHLHVNENLDANAIRLLIGAGLGNRFPQLYKQWQQESAYISSNARVTRASTEASIKRNLENDSPLLTRIIHRALVDAIIGIFPTFNHDSFPDPTKSEQGILIAQGPVEPVIAPSKLTDGSPPHSVEREHDSTDVQDQLQAVIKLYPGIGEALHRTVQMLRIEIIDSRDFKTCKERVCIAQRLLQQLPDVQMKEEDFLNVILYGDMEHVKESLNSIAQDATPHGQPKNFLNKALSGLNSLISSGPRSQSLVDQMLKDAEASASTLSDAQFLVQLDDIEKLPVMKNIVAETRAAALMHFKSLLTKQTTILTHYGMRIQIDTCLAQARGEVVSGEEQQLAELRKRFIVEINACSLTSHNSRTLLIDAVEDERGSSVQITGSRRSFEQPKLKFTVHLMQLTTQDLHSLQFDPSTIPSPKFKNSYSFKLPVGDSVVRAQLLPGEQVLLATTDRVGNLTVYLEHLTAIEGVLAHGGRGKRLNHGKIGEFVLAFDESKRMLSIVATEKFLLHVFVYDDTRGFQASGSTINLTQWYAEETSISHACFICGSEELLLVDTFAQARVYSLTTLQFRPATLNLLQIPTAVYSTPDGSCLIAAHVRMSDLTLTAYHWSTFGSTVGTPLEIPDLPSDQPLLLTSLTSRNIVHLVTLDVATRSCRSIALDITRKVTEFTFKEKGARGGHAMSENVRGTANNCLIDCHAEVWTRFPVLPAVQRETITSSSSRCQRTLAFVTDRDHNLFVPHFQDLISNFERTSKKPTGNLLKSMLVSATTFSAFSDSLLGGAEWSLSKFRADGVYSTELEKSLLGADVNRIVDYVSFGWYESLFQSYMAKKPVKVVSSMGEQSVGKSFSLNHLVDTSFAGSAMRTTEGVWMSVTPTRDALVVALDFEGVIERSAQEDTLLVLFNTAISNLVLFRNNFALSRDITGLFQSFQSSSTVLDPAANPSLFQSTLVIIIKDVVDSDKAEITKEFALKFQRIVHDEQEANFISRLHAGQLTIVSWPVIESREFYKLFPTLKRRLDKQKRHNTAGEFLHVMKTLMAKLKANDWGALSQSMASHRAQLLLALLPNALAYGLQEVNPDPEPLKNLDNDVPIDIPDTPSEFSLATGGMQQSSSREAALQVLSHAWGDYDSRHYVSEDVWIENLTTHIDSLVGLRIAHVGEWISSNVARFQTGQASIDELMRAFDSATLRATLCSEQTARWTAYLPNFSCLYTSLRFLCFIRRDQGLLDVRDIQAIIYVSLMRIFVVKFADYLGDRDVWMSVIGHAEGDHLCAATVHACGQPCDLSKLTLADGSTPPCRDTCGIPSDVDHNQHQCDARLCSFPCQLCKRLCTNTSHLHGLQDGALHLCGEEHLCSRACTVDGICEIETTPQSIEATFTGRHETFQYTKYSQVAKRLRCMKSIPPGAVVHKGPHNHSLDKNVVHFCRERCEHCGYYCTLPLGHPQQEHETRHGSMSSSRWAVDGPDDTGLKVEGRRFSSNDEGTPMMCNLVCQAVGRHIHVDYCRAPDASACRGNSEVQHISKRLVPNPERAKDYVTHNLFWRRAGFKDPYSQEEQANFAKCDSMCGGPEHTAAAGNAAQPSYCTLPLFHPPVDPNNAQVG
ncbi:hypothetical protein EDB19DRAFT_2044892 [Suillus lakei]|nr:hypothetical protein EDB19DRAFT_2044892 [Suillus lakei]